MFFYAFYIAIESLNFSFDFFSLLFNDSTPVLTPSSKLLNCFFTTNSFPGILILISAVLFSLSLEFSNLRKTSAFNILSRNLLNEETIFSMKSIKSDEALKLIFQEMN